MPIPLEELVTTSINGIMLLAMRACLVSWKQDWCYPRVWRPSSTPRTSKKKSSLGNPKDSSPRDWWSLVTPQPTRRTTWRNWSTDTCRENANTALWWQARYGALTRRLNLEARGQNNNQSAITSSPTTRVPNDGASTQQRHPSMPSTWSINTPNHLPTTARPWMKHHHRSLIRRHWPWSRRPDPSEKNPERLDDANGKFTLSAESCVLPFFAPEMAAVLTMWPNIPVMNIPICTKYTYHIMLPWIPVVTLVPQKHIFREKMVLIFCYRQVPGMPIILVGNLTLRDGTLQSCFFSALHLFNDTTGQLCCRIAFQLETAPMSHSYIQRCIQFP